MTPRRTSYSAALMAIILMLLASATPVSARKKKTDHAIATTPYIATQEPPPPTLGSLWVPVSGIGNLASDYKARKVNDLVTIRIIENTTATSDGSLKSDRKFQTDSGISGLVGQLAATNRLQHLFTAQAGTSLSGDAATSSSTHVTTTLTGRVIQVYPNGNLMIEASRQVEVNSQRQEAVLRGIVRAGDIGPDNSIPSSSLSDLQVELKGKGVVSDAVRPPNPIVRLLLRLLTF
ncbi:MAG: flagellar basal body L-ring protein FlgH [Acidobacteriia bacterium]|nr:flagellar basal body L-ring protein FlgH [Terriglobia bacterium]